MSKLENEADFGGRLSETERRYYRALFEVEAGLVRGMREILEIHNFLELSSSTLFQITGVSKDPFESPLLESKIEDAVQEATQQTHHYQLETLCYQLRRRLYTVGKTFKNTKALNKSSRLNEVSKFECILPFGDTIDSIAFDKLLSMVEELVKFSLNEIVENEATQIKEIGGDISHLLRTLRRSFVRIQYSDLASIIDVKSDSISGRELALFDRESLVKNFCGSPVIILNFPTELSPASAKRATVEPKSYSFELVFPKIGTVASGAIYEEKKQVLRENVESLQCESRITRGCSDLPDSLSNYFQSFDEDSPIKIGGFSISFESLKDFIIENSERSKEETEGFTESAEPSLSF